MNNPSLSAMAFGLADAGKCPDCQKYYGWNGALCACPAIDWEGHTSQFTFNERDPVSLRKVSDYPVTIERCHQRDGSHLWAVRTLSGRVLNHDGEWEFEPQPSSRDGEFMERCRFPTKEAAYKAWKGVAV